MPSQLFKRSHNPELEEGFIKTSNAEWHVLRNGQGGDTWVVLHGFGQHAVLMLRFMEAFRPKDRVIAINLPFHGKTKLVNDELDLGDITELLGKCLRQENVERCSLLGYSLGGKMALKMVELSPGRIERLVLIAPDGLKVNPFYRLATRTLVGNWIFRSAMNNPKGLLSVSSLLVKTKLMDQRVLEFYQRQLEKQEVRDMIYGSWMAFSDLTPDLVLIRKNIFRYKIVTELIFGKHDRVIHPKLAAKLSGHHVKTAKVHILDRGHELTTDDAANEIANRLK